MNNEEQSKYQASNPYVPNEVAVGTATYQAPLMSEQQVPQYYPQQQPQQYQVPPPGQQNAYQVPPPGQQYYGGYQPTVTVQTYATPQVPQQPAVVYSSNTICCFAFLSFIIPIVGFIFFCLYHSTAPQLAKPCLYCAITSFIINFVFVVIFLTTLGSFY